MFCTVFFATWFTNILGRHCKVLYHKRSFHTQVAINHQSSGQQKLWLTFLKVSNGKKYFHHSLKENICRKKVSKHCLILLSLIFLDHSISARNNEKEKQSFKKLGIRCNPVLPCQPHHTNNSIFPLSFHQQRDICGWTRSFPDLFQTNNNNLQSYGTIQAFIWFINCYRFMRLHWLPYLSHGGHKRGASVKALQLFLGVYFFDLNIFDLETWI